MRYHSLSYSYSWNLGFISVQKGYGDRVGVGKHQAGDTVPRVTRQEVPDSSAFSTLSERTCVTCMHSVPCHGSDFISGEKKHFFYQVESSTLNPTHGSIAKFSFRSNFGNFGEIDVYLFFTIFTREKENFNYGWAKLQKEELTED